MLGVVVLDVVDADDVGLARGGLGGNGEGVLDGVERGRAGVADVLVGDVDGGLVDRDRGLLADPALGADDGVALGEHAVLVVVDAVAHCVLGVVVGNPLGSNDVVAIPIRNRVVPSAERVTGASWLIFRIGQSWVLLEANRCLNGIAIIGSLPGVLYDFGGSVKMPGNGDILQFIAFVHFCPDALRAGVIICTI